MKFFSGLFFAINTLVILSAARGNAAEQPVENLPDHLVKDHAKWVPDSCHQYAEFKQEKYLEGLANPLISRGKILLDCERGTLWQTNFPIQETTVYQFSGKHWLVKSSGAATEIKNSAQKRVGNILARIVRGDQTFIDEHFRRELIAPEDSAAQTTSPLTRLLPTHKRLQKYIEHIELEEIPDGRRVMVKRVYGQDMRLEISAIRPLASLSLPECQQWITAGAGCAQLFAGSAK